MREHGTRLRSWLYVFRSIDELLSMLVRELKRPVRKLAPVREIKGIFSANF